MPSLQTTVDRDLDRALTVVTFAGELNLFTTSKVRAELLKCVVEFPLAIVIDVERLLVTNRTALTVFRAVQHHRPRGPLVVLALCAAPTTATGRAARRILGRVLPVYASRDRAVTAVLAGQAGIKRVYAHLAADPRSAGTARRLVADACVSWGLADLADAATLIVSELVSNAVRYAGTAFDLTATLRGAYLHIAVRDGNCERPMMPPRSVAGFPSLTTSGRGLHLVADSAAGWGTTVAGDGKVVWAALRIGASHA
jgi:anti-sigma regulatory factor (Ser/Thr protein kinase)